MFGDGEVEEPDGDVPKETFIAPPGGPHFRSTSQPLPRGEQVLFSCPREIAEHKIS